MNQRGNVSYSKKIGILGLLFVFLLVGCVKKGAKTAKEDAQLQETSAVVSVEGAELHYVIEGKGTPLHCSRSFGERTPHIVSGVEKSFQVCLYGLKA